MAGTPRPISPTRIAAAETAHRGSRARRPARVAWSPPPSRAPKICRRGSADAARQRLGAIAPRPYLADHAAAGRAAGSRNSSRRSAEVVWIAGELDGGDGRRARRGARPHRRPRGTVLQSSRPLTVLRPPENRADGVRVPVARLGGAGEVAIAGFDQEGRRIVEGSAVARRRRRGRRARSRCRRRSAIRSSRFAVTGEESAGAVQLLDGRWQRKAVGLIAGESAGASQPLLEPLTYVERALAPTSDLLRSDAAEHQRGGARR